jgi:hypothetical protein
VITCGGKWGERWRDNLRWYYDKHPEPVEGCGSCEVARFDKACSEFIEGLGALR